MGTSQQQFTDALLQRYLEGNCTWEEEKVIQDWYESLDLTAGKAPALTAGQEAWLRERLPGLPVKRTPVIRRAYVQWSAAAAVLVAMIIAAFYLRETGKNARPLTASVFATNAREVKKLTLPDGTQVWLNQLSRLEWTGDSNDTVRLVKLNGEARFNVAPQVAKPFLVQAGATTTRVLGTEFNVEAYTEEQEVKVALLSGKVQFAAAGTPGAALLQPGRMVTSRKGHPYSITDISNEVDAWTKGFTVFNEVPVAEAFARLANRNGWQLVWKRKDRPYEPVSAIFSRETPAQMLEGIAFTHHVKYSINNNVLTIY